MRKVILVIFFIINIMNYSYAYEFSLGDFTNALSKFDNEFISSEDYSGIVGDIQNSNFNFDYKKIFTGVSKVFSKELKNNIGIVIEIIIIAVLSGFLNNLKSNFAPDGIGKIAFYMCYVVIITIILGSFMQILNVSKEAILSLVAFMDAFLPILTGIIISTGAINTTSMIYPIIIFVTNAISNFVNNFMMVIVMVTFAISMVSNISDKIKITKMAGMIRSMAMWIMGIVLTIFVGIVTLEGSIATTVDGITIKTAKFMFSNGVPVVGKLLGDSIDTLLGSTLVLKDAIGFIGVLILLTLILIPIIKIIIFLILYNGVVALIEPFSEPNLIKCMNETIEASKLLLALVITVSIMFFVGIVSMIKITNGVAMYR